MNLVPGSPLWLLVPLFLALAAAAVELPIVPGTGDVIAVEPAFAKRPADVVADTGDRAEFSAAKRQRDARAPRDYGLQLAFRELVGGADVYPVRLGHADSINDVADQGMPLRCANYAGAARGTAKNTPNSAAILQLTRACTLPCSS